MYLTCNLSSNCKSNDVSKFLIKLTSESIEHPETKLLSSAATIINVLYLISKDDLKSF